MRSAGSKANGALMRVAPVAIWAHRQGDSTIAACAASDAMLSHPNTACQDASAAYCIALAHLIQHPGDSAGAVERAEAWAAQHAEPEVCGWVYGGLLGGRCGGCAAAI
jgi:ADP-ribosyl-[dinitrogen reductase] hydrolase